MKLLVLTSSYPRFDSDISGAFVKRWAQSLRDLGHDVTILVWEDQCARPTIREPGLTVHWVRYAFKRERQVLFFGQGAIDGLEDEPARARLIPAALSAMWCVACRHMSTHDMVIGHWLVPCGVLARLLGWFWQKPSFVVGHSGGVHVLSRLHHHTPVLGKLLSHVLAGSDDTTSLSFVRRAHLVRFETWLGRPSSAVVAPMGFDVVTSSVRPDPKAWLVMGRLVSIKRVDAVIRAFWHADLPGGVTLHVAGDGPERAALEHQAQQLAVASPQNKKVVFHGIVTGQIKRDLLACCGVAVFGSCTTPTGRQEGIPVSFLEACGAGCLPMVAHLEEVESFLSLPSMQQLHEDVARWPEQMTQLIHQWSHERAAWTQRAVKHLDWSAHGLLWHDMLIQCVARSSR